MKKTFVIRTTIKDLTFSYETDTDISDIVYIAKNMRLDGEFYLYILSLSNKIKKIKCCDDLNKNFINYLTSRGNVFLTVSEFEKYLLEQKYFSQEEIAYPVALLTAIQTDITLGIIERILCNESNESELSKTFNTIKSFPFINYSVDRNQRQGIENQINIEKEIVFLQNLFNDILMENMENNDMLKGILSLHVLNQSSVSLDILFSMYMGSRDFYNNIYDKLPKDDSMPDLKNTVLATDINIESYFSGLKTPVNSNEDYSYDKIYDNINKCATNDFDIDSTDFSEQGYPILRNPDRMDMETSNPLYISNLKCLCTKCFFIHFINHSILNTELIILDNFITQCVELEYRIRNEETPMHLAQNNEISNELIENIFLAKNFLLMCYSERNELNFYMSMTKTYHEFGIVASAIREKNIGYAIDHKFSYETLYPYMGNATKYIIQKNNSRKHFKFEMYGDEDSNGIKSLDEIMSTLSFFFIYNSHDNCTIKLSIESQLLKENNNKDREKEIVFAWNKNCDYINISRRSRDFFAKLKSQEQRKIIKSRDVLCYYSIKGKISPEEYESLLKLQRDNFDADWKLISKSIGDVILAYHNNQLEQYLDDNFNYRQTHYLFNLLKELAEDGNRIEDLWCKESWRQCKQEWIDSCKLEH